MNIKPILLPTLLLLLSFTIVKAQEDKKIDPKRIEKEKIHNLFSKAMSREAFRDTNMIYMFAYKVDVRKDKEGKVRIWQVDASDTVAKKIFKNLDFLKEINYSLFMGKSDRSTFVFPIAIMLAYPGKKESEFINQTTLGEKLQNYWFERNFAEDPIETYLYFPALIVRTTTITDY